MTDTLDVHVDGTFAGWLNRGSDGQVTFEYADSFIHRRCPQWG